MVVKRMFTWAFVAFLIFFVAYFPAGAASVAKWLGRILTGLANGFGDFISRLA